MTWLAIFVICNQPGLRAFHIVLYIHPRHRIYYDMFRMVCINLWMPITHLL
jgi:hypothetical protein